jgi:hypothetical protein
LVTDMGRIGDIAAVVAMKARDGMGERQLGDGNLL